jgi:hypothetical protein
MKTVVGNIESKILAHDGEADETDVGLGLSTHRMNGNHSILSMVRVLRLPAACPT